jgi:hypothetical protein
MKKANSGLDRKSLAELAMNHPEVFERVSPWDSRTRWTGQNAYTAVSIGVAEVERPAA